VKKSYGPGLSLEALANPLRVVCLRAVGIQESDDGPGVSSDRAPRLRF